MTCLSHIITNAKEISREHALLPQTEKDKHVDTFTGRLKDLCARASGIGQKLKSGDISQPSAKRI